MSGLSIALLVLFVIVCAIIIFLILLQNEEGDSLGGLFAGGSNSAFGSKSGNVLTKATYIAVTLFFVTTFLLAFLNKGVSDKGLLEEVKQGQSETSTQWWKDEVNTEKDNAAGAEAETKSENSSEGTSQKDGEE